MLHTMPVLNCMHFLMPVGLDNWTSYDVPGVVGVLRKRESGQYELVDAFDCDSIPGARDLAQHQNFAQWVTAAGGTADVRFDVFLMPKADETQRHDVVTLIQRSCGFRLDPKPAYVNAA
ncbi:MAG: hypothetical protein IPG73_09905 [Ignavibacteria bacterium]|nr:hypothetical protein [Ignavibacteria bacterium]MBK7032018.1 hypothetical protein [Ignavibacteria bacterium]